MSYIFEFYCRPLPYHAMINDMLYQNLEYLQDQTNFQTIFLYHFGVLCIKKPNVLRLHVWLLGILKTYLFVKLIRKTIW